MSDVKFKGRTDNQITYIRSMSSNTITLCHGPAGSGKTYLACAKAAQMLVKGRIEKIVLSRPLASCGQEIGFLPGGVREKMDPYLQPLYDELGNFFPVSKIKALCQDGLIEIVPLALMRGRTFNNSFVILDEAQNAIYKELKMFLTRLGTDSKMVLAGDVGQVDIDYDAYGFVTRKLEDVEGVAVCEMTHTDIVRHGIISRILRALP